MKKIMFNDEYDLTQAVLSGCKTMTRRMITQPPYKNFDIVFPLPDVAFDDKHPLNGAFCWVNKDNEDERTEWIRPKYKVGEEVAVAQAYLDLYYEGELTAEQYQGIIEEVGKLSAGCHNKMFVKASLMPNRIRITNVKLQRLRDISYNDCLKEGVVECALKIGSANIKKYYPSLRHAKAAKEMGWGFVCDTARDAFSRLINWVSGDGTWENNPYVFVYEFELIK